MGLYFDQNLRIANDEKFVKEYQQHLEFTKQYIEELKENE